jgi:antitoxin ParD1/3/4
MTGSTDLGQPFEEFVDELVRSGRYETRNDVLKEGLRLLQLRDQRTRDLDAALARGLAQAEAGLGTPIEEVLAEFEKRYANRTKQRSA